MPKTIYWAVLLNDISKSKLIEKAKEYNILNHPNIYCEHITLAFNPPKLVDDTLMDLLGVKKSAVIVGYKSDIKCSAVVVSDVQRIGGGVPHITVCCADKIKPAYSNELLDGGWNYMEPLTLDGVIARYTKKGWIKGKNGELND